jgi:NADH-quinone oxidoreductase subunit C
MSDASSSPSNSSGISAPPNGAGSPDGGRPESAAKRRNREALERLRAVLERKAGGMIDLSSMHVSIGHLVAYSTPAKFGELAALLRNDPELRFDFLVDVTVVDWMDSRDVRFEAVYHFLSTSTLARLRVKVPVDEDDAKIPSLCSLWDTANFLEREAWDMYGIDFTGHPDQRRILMYDEFVGHPLRKDYPLQGKQPRIPLRAPEVRNTSVDMKRPALVQINRKR